MRENRPIDLCCPGTPEFLEAYLTAYRVSPGEEPRKTHPDLGVCKRGPSLTGGSNLWSPHQGPPIEDTPTKQAPPVEQPPPTPKKQGQAQPLSKVKGEPIKSPPTKKPEATKKGQPTKSQGRPRANLDVERARRLKSNGYTLAAIAKQLGVSEMTVRRALKGG